MISLIFIGEPVTSLINVFRAHPLGVHYYADNATALLASPAPAAPAAPATLNATLLDNSTLSGSTLVYLYMYMSP